MAFRRLIAMVVLVLAFVPAALLPAQDETRGVGIYPGDPKEDFGPLLVPGGPQIRNLALRRAAYQSSSYDDNLTAQLVTDGIRQAQLPRWLSTATSERGVARKVERELLVDGNVVSTVTLEHPPAWVELELAGGDAPLEVDRVELQATLRPHAFAAMLAPPGPQDAPRRWACIVRGSDDGQAWTELGRAEGELPASFAPPADAGFAAWFWRGPVVRPSVSLARPARSRFYRVSVEPAGAVSWTVSELALFAGKHRVEVGGPYRFDSAWMTEGSGDGVGVRRPGGAAARSTAWRSHWIRRAAEGSMQVSDDAASWRDVAALPAATRSRRRDPAGAGRARRATCAC